MRQWSPADQCLPLFGDQLVDCLFRDLTLVRIGRQKDHANTIGSRLRERDVQVCFCDLGEEVVRNPGDNPGAIARIDFATARATMSHVLQHPQGVIHDLT